MRSGYSSDRERVDGATTERFEGPTDCGCPPYQGLESLRADILPKNPRNFAFFAEGPLDKMQKLQAEITDYVSRLEHVGAA